MPLGRHVETVPLSLLRYYRESSGAGVVWVLPRFPRDFALRGLSGAVIVWCSPPLRLTVDSEPRWGRFPVFLPVQIRGCIERGYRRVFLCFAASLKSRQARPRWGAPLFFCSAPIRCFPRDKLLLLPV